MNDNRLLWMLKIFSMILALVAVMWTMRIVKSPSFQSQTSSFFQVLEGR